MTGGTTVSWLEERSKHLKLVNGSTSSPIIRILFDAKFNNSKLANDDSDVVNSLMLFFAISSSLRSSIESSSAGTLSNAFPDNLTFNGWLHASKPFKPDADDRRLPEKSNFASFPFLRDISSLYALQTLLFSSLRFYSNLFSSMRGCKGSASIDEGGNPGAVQGQLKKKTTKIQKKGQKTKTKTWSVNPPPITSSYRVEHCSIQVHTILELLFYRLTFEIHCQTDAKR